MDRIIAINTTTRPILLTNAISRRTRYRRVAIRHWSDTDIAAWTVVLAFTALIFLFG
jgi:hypothetical protein